MGSAIEKYLLYKKALKPSDTVDTKRLPSKKSIKLSREELIENRIVAGLNDGPYAEIFKILRTKVMHKLRAEKWTNIAITSPREGSGKSLITVNLAITLAMDESNTVVVVDLDLKRPRVHQYFNFEPEGGLVDCLQNKISVDEYIISTGFDRLFLLPAGDATSDSAELLSSSYMTNVLEEIKNYHRDAIVLFDLPPLLDTADTLILLPYVDSCLLVAEDGVTTAEEVDHCLHLLDDYNFLGTVLNKVSDEPQRYYYGKSVTPAKRRPSRYSLSLVEKIRRLFGTSGLP